MWIFFQRYRHSSSPVKAKTPTGLGGLAPWARKASTGFTLIELLVVISIMLVLSSVFLLRQQKFDSSTLLRSMAYSIALSVRQAQVFGSSIRETSVGSGTFATSYGVYMSTGDLSHYYLFADNGDGVYSGDTNSNGSCDAGEDCIVTKFTIGGSGSDYQIQKFCATTISGSIQYCSDVGGGPTSLTIFFRRPNPDGCFATSLDVSSPCLLPNPQVYQSAYIQVIGPDGVTTRSISVTQTGAISVGGAGT